MAEVSMDDAELRRLTVDLTAAGSRIASEVRPVVHKGAGAIKDQLRREMAESTFFHGIADAIDYSMRSGMDAGVGAIEAEIGPRSGPGQEGALANIAYFGTSRGGGTVPDPQHALEAEAPNVERALADVVEKLLR